MGPHTIFEPKTKDIVDLTKATSVSRATQEKQMDLVNELGQDHPFLKYLNRLQTDKALAPYGRKLGGTTTNHYWGGQSGTTGPVYIGAVFIVLFIFGMVFIKSNMKWYIFGVTVFAVMLSWGKYFYGFNSFIVDYLPYYDKFRAVTMVLFIVELTVPFLGILFLKELFENKEAFKLKKKGLLITSGSILGLLLLFIMAPTFFFSFIKAPESDTFIEMMDKGVLSMEEVQEYQSAITDVRVSIFKSSVGRTFGLALCTIGLIFAFVYSNAIKPIFASIGALILISVDLIGISSNYLSAEQDQSDHYKYWVEKAEMRFPLRIEKADKDIMAIEGEYIDDFSAKVKDVNSKMKSYYTNKKGYGEDVVNAASTKLKSLATSHVVKSNSRYRVFDFERDAGYSNSRTSYWHSSLGGYHGAKLQSIQNLKDFVINKDLQGFAEQKETPSLNMMNVKYITYGGGTKVFENKDALGNAWFVSGFEQVDNADSAIMAIHKVDLREKAIVIDKHDYTPEKSENAKIELVQIAPDKLIYESNNEKVGFAVFSELYYPNGWTVTIDGKPVQFEKVNYLLRGLKIPAGKHKIEAVYNPEAHYASLTVSNIFNWIVILLIIGGVVMLILKGRTKEEKLEQGSTEE